jgi:hypothetical protein
LNKNRMITQFPKIIAILATAAPDKDQPTVPLRSKQIANEQ